MSDYHLDRVRQEAREMFENWLNEQFNGATEEQFDAAWDEEMKPFYREFFSVDDLVEEAHNSSATNDLHK